MKTLEVKAGSIDEAIEKGLAELGKTREEVDIEIIDAGGFLKKAKVILTVKPSEGETALEFLKELLKKMNFKADVQLKEDGEKAEITVIGEDSGNIIGYRGDVLDAIQYITTVAVNKNKENYKKIIIDCENYRARRTATLEALAAKRAEFAFEKGRKVTLEPMNPFERRVIHSALQSNEQVTTESEGSEPNRYVVIIPKNYNPANDRPFRENSNRGGYRKDGFGGGRGGYSRGDNREGGFNRDRNQKDAGYNSREGGYGNRDRNTREGGFNRERDGNFSRDNNREGGFNRERNSKDGYGDRRQGGGYAKPAPKKTTFNSFGTYLGNTKSGFSSDNDFTKKSGFDNLKD